MELMGSSLYPSVRSKKDEFCKRRGCCTQSFRKPDERVVENLGRREQEVKGRKGVKKRDMVKVSPEFCIQVNLERRRILRSHREVVDFFLRV